MRISLILNSWMVNILLDLAAVLPGVWQAEVLKWGRARSRNCRAIRQLVVRRAAQRPAPCNRRCLGSYAIERQGIGCRGTPHPNMDRSDDSHAYRWAASSRN